ncbi:MAG: hypothetical protein V3T21_03015 [Candidatus Margulisiibacteriota bacterium]
MKKNRQGSALLLVIFILATFMVLGAINAKIVYNYYASANAVLQREQAFHLAEAGLEKGKVELTHNPNWYTDLPYYLKDNVDWLVGYAVGQETQFGEGSFKIIREKDKNRLYSIGFKGKGMVVLKLKFSNFPFQSLEWKEL